MEWICAKQLICVTTLYDKENSNLFKNELYGEEIKSLIRIKTKAISLIAYAYKIEKRSIRYKRVLFLRYACVCLRD